jgi:hypothetical protein
MSRLRPRLLKAAFVAVVALSATWLMLRLAALAYVVWVLRGYESTHGATDPEYNHSRSFFPAVDWSRDSGPLYRAAGELVDPSTAYEKGWRSASGQNDVAALRDIEKRLAPGVEPALDLFDGAAGRDSCVLSDRAADGFEIWTSRFTQLWVVANARLIGARVRGMEGDLEGFGKGLDSVLAFAACAESDPSSFAPLGARLESQALAALREAWEAGRSLPIGTEAILRRRIAAMPEVDLSRLLAFEAILSTPRRDGWLDRAPGQEPRLPRWLAMPSLGRALELHALRLRIDAVKRSDPPPSGEGDVWPGLGRSRVDSRSFWFIARRLDLLRSERLLAVTAIDAAARARRTGRHEEHSASVATVEAGGGLVADRVEWLRLPDGGLELSLPETQRRWREIKRLDLRQPLAGSVEPLLGVRLPPPPPLTSARSPA